MAESLQQTDNRRPDAAVDPEMFPAQHNGGTHSGSIAAVVFAIFCASGLLAFFAFV